MSYLAGSSIASATQMASCGVWLGDIRFLEVKLIFSTSEGSKDERGFDTAWVDVLKIFLSEMRGT